MTRASSTSSEEMTGQWAGAVVSVAGHLIGIAVVALGSLWLLVGSGHLESMWAIHQHQGSWNLAWPQAPVHAMLAAVVWFVGLLLWRNGLLAARRDKARLVSARGTVITETLIVMPVLLLILLGVAQLAVNNIANMLFNYGSHQAARTAWVWHPELAPIDGGTARMEVSEEQVEDMVRLQLAAAMTPVAPSQFSNQRDIESHSFQQMRALLLSHQQPTPVFDAGLQGVETAVDIDIFETANDLSFSRALDGSTFPQRTVRKFTSAYQAVELELLEEEMEIGVDIKYQHQITFPLMGPIFGEPVRVDGVPGPYMRLSSEIFYPKQVAPNAELPRP